MAIKKNELYSSLWASCDKLRGGMDASQYKDYILTLLFVKYVTDKFKGVKYADITVPEGGSFDDIVALKNNPNIGEEMDKVIAKLAESDNNQLHGVIDNAHFNDESKLGKGQEMVDKLTGLIGIFQRPEFDFKNNKANGDDILGDAYEYLMRNFATESGKSKGQFYTPAEVSRILAKVIGIDKVNDSDASVYDPACGSGSLLIRAADEARIPVAIYGQEKEITTAGLAKMNLVLHNKATGEIYTGNTFADPKYRDKNDNDVLRRFDFIVANPPFSLKNWTDGLKEFGRFDGYGDRPPEKNGDFAWLLHILKSLKRTGKAAVILPHGVLFRGNAEAAIRKTIIDKGYIKGIIGLPANLFYGTGIPACIIVIDKEDADEREGIFMIDASHGFVKDGNKNRLREQDIYKIVTTFNNQISTDPKYARFVPNYEIKITNDYNLNIPRYINSSTAEDLQDIDAHLRGGIPAVDVDSMENYWNLFPKLKEKLFSPLRDGYYQLNVSKDDVRTIVYTDGEFSAYSARIDAAFEAWKNDVDAGLRNVDEFIKIKEYIVELSEILIAKYADIELVDKYDVYQVLLSYWQQTMADDVYVLVQDGYEAGREIENIYEVSEEKKTKKEKIKYKGWEGKLIPKSLVESAFFSADRAKIDEIQAICDETQSMLDELVETVDENSVVFDIVDDGDVKLKDVKEKLDEIYSTLTSETVEALSDLLAILPMKKKEYEAYIAAHPLCECAYNEKGTVTKASVKQAIMDERAKCEIPATYREDYSILLKLQNYLVKIAENTAVVKELSTALDEACKIKYTELTVDEIKELLVNRKWYHAIFEDINALYETTSHEIAGRISELAERYEDTLPSLESEVASYEAKVKSHLERMGFVW